MIAPLLSCGPATSFNSVSMAMHDRLSAWTAGLCNFLVSFAFVLQYTL